MSAADTVITGSLLLAIPVSFAAGVVSFLSPCVLPLVPGYLSFMTGLTGADLADEAVSSAEAAAREPATVGAAGRGGVALAAAPPSARCGTGPVGCSPGPCCSSSGSPWCSCRTAP